MKLIKDRGVEVIIPKKSLFAEESKNVVVEFIKEFPEMAPLVNEIKNN